MNPLQCPTCDLRWNIPDNAGRIITCPRCLAALNNPYSPGPQESRPVGTKPPPLPVIPLEHQVDRDQRSGQIGLIVIAIVIIVGVILFITAIASGANTGISGIIGLIVVTSVALIPVILIYRKKQTPTSAIPMTQFPPPLLPGGVLNYSAPMRDPRKLSPSAFFAQTIGGIILGIAGGAALFAALMGMVRQRKRRPGHLRPRRRWRRILFETPNPRTGRRLDPRAAGRLRLIAGVLCDPHRNQRVSLRKT